jgi:hypothetical protein
VALTHAHTPFSGLQALAGAALQIR